MELTPTPGVFDITWHWPCYRIELGSDGTWTAARKGEPLRVLYAGSERQLRDLIRQDFFDWKGA